MNAADPGEHQPRRQTDRIPSLFNLAVEACISHVDQFASFEGFPFIPFGKALVAEFERRANSWQLSSEQREVGALLFAEAYGLEYLGPEYTGLRCSRIDDIPFLGVFSGCLAYLDLSGGRAFTDKDMAGLASLSQLRVLDVSGLQVGDVGLSHLIRSVTFGASGPKRLEYFNLARTLVTDRGIARMFLEDQRLAFPRLLGIDLTGSKVHDEVVWALFRRQKLPSMAPDGAKWAKLETGEQLFPDLTIAEQGKEARTEEKYETVKKDGRSEFKGGSLNRKPTKPAIKHHRIKTRYYKEPGTLVNPIQKWVDRLFYQYQSSSSKERLSNNRGNDKLGISGVLGLMKLSQVSFKPLSDAPVNYQELEPIGHCSNTKALGDPLVDPFMSKSLAELEQRRIAVLGYGKRYIDNEGRRAIKNSNIDVMPGMVSRKYSHPLRCMERQRTENDWNDIQYERVLASIRETYGIRWQLKASTAISSEQPVGIMFVRSRSAVQEISFWQGSARPALVEVNKQDESVRYFLTQRKPAINGNKANIRSRSQRMTATGPTDITSRSYVSEGSTLHTSNPASPSAYNSSNQRPLTPFQTAKKIRRWPVHTHSSQRLNYIPAYKTPGRLL